MISIKLSNEPGRRNVALRVGNTPKLLVEDWQYIEKAMGGLLAHPTPFPSPEDCREVCYSFLGEDGTDLLDEDTPVATHISDEDLRQLSEGIELLQAHRDGARKTQEDAIDAFRLPDRDTQPEYYRECFDPVTGKKHLAVIWGVGVTDESGRLVVEGHNLDSARNMLIRRLRLGDESAPRTARGPGAGVAAEPAPALIPVGAPSSECRCWTVGLIFLGALLLVAGLLIWWGNSRFERLARKLDEAANLVSVMHDRINEVGLGLDDANRKIEKLKEDNKKLADALAGAETAVKDAEAKLTDTKEKLRAAESRADNLQANADKLQKNLEDTQKQLGEKEKEFAALLAGLDKLLVSLGRQGAGLSVDAQLLLEHVNKLRAEHKLPPLAIDDKDLKEVNPLPPEKKPWGKTDGSLLPPYDNNLPDGEKTIKVISPKDKAVDVGVRCDEKTDRFDKGRNFAVAGGGSNEVTVPTGNYKLFFVYKDKPDELYQGGDLDLTQPRITGYTITLMQVQNGNYAHWRAIDWEKKRGAPAPPETEK